jgi:hypothetical protein
MRYRHRRVSAYWGRECSFSATVRSSQPRI